MSTRNYFWRVNAVAPSHNYEIRTDEVDAEGVNVMDNGTLVLYEGKTPVVIYAPKTWHDVRRVVITKVD